MTVKRENEAQEIQKDWKLLMEKDEDGIQRINMPCDLSIPLLCSGFAIFGIFELLFVYPFFGYMFAIISTLLVYFVIIPITYVLSEYSLKRPTFK